MRSVRNYSAALTTALSARTGLGGERPSLPFEERGVPFERDEHSLAPASATRTSTSARLADETSTGGGGAERSAAGAGAREPTAPRQQ